MIALKDFKKLIKRASQPMARGDETDARQRGPIRQSGVYWVLK